MSGLKGMILLFCIVLALFIIPTACASVVINEIMYNPNQCDDSVCEWIELYNPTDAGINLTGWAICGDELLAGYINESDDQLYSNTTVIIATRGYAIVTDGGTGTGVYDNFDVNPNAIALHVYGSSICGGLNNNGDTVTLTDSASTIDSVTYDDSWGADDDGNSLQLGCGDSWCASTPTPGAASSCGRCDGESCSGASECQGDYCVHNICRNSSTYCNDGYCDTGENCSCPDCEGKQNGCSSGQLCCNGSCTNITCFSNDNCIGGKVCQNAGTCNASCVLQTCSYWGGTCCSVNQTCGGGSFKNSSNCGFLCCVGGTCTVAHFCGDGTCDVDEGCANCSTDCEGKQNGCASGKLCCYGSCAYVCSSDSNCPSGEVCLNPGTCNASCVDASTVICDLTLNISAEIFKVSITQNYYLYVNDTIGNYTGSALVGYWIEDSNGTYIRYHSPYNTTINVNENKSREYTPLTVCGNRTYYIKAKIEDTKCNDVDLTNNDATKAITIWGLDPSSAECFKNVTYELEIPAKVKAEETFTISVDIENNQNVSQKVEVWSYVYKGAKCYSCYWNETEESNKQVISIPAGSSAIVELQNRVNATNGTYYIKVKILKEGFSTPEELMYEVDIIKEEAPIAEEMEEEGEAEEEGEEGKIIYESKSEKIKKIAMYVLSALLSATAIYFVIVKRKKIGEFVAKITTKKQEFTKKREWKRYLQERRPGILKRLSKGFLKPGGEARE